MADVQAGPAGNALVVVERPTDLNLIWNGAFAQAEAAMGRVWAKLRTEWLGSFKSAATRRAYTTATDQWLDFLSTQVDPHGQLVQPWTVDASHVRAWLRMLEAAHSPATVNQRLAACSSWYSFVINERHMFEGKERTAFADIDGHTRSNPFQANNIARPETVAYREARPLSLGQMNRLLAVWDTETLSGARNYALIYTAFLTGWRVAEVIGMQWGRIRPHRTEPGHYVYEWAGKGGKSQDDALPMAVYNQILHYLRVAGRIPQGTLVVAGADCDTIRGHEYIWQPVSDGAGGNLRQFEEGDALDPERHISPQTANRVLRSGLKKAGLPVNHRFHDLRHTLAHAHYEQFKDLRATQELLHHSSPTTTIKYLTSMTEPIDTHSAAIVQQMRMSIA